MQQYGAFLTTHETVLFAMLKSNTHAKFKEVQRLILTLNRPTGLVDPRLWTVHSLPASKDVQ